MSDGIRVNGIFHSWGSIVVKFDGDRYYGFQAISYGHKRTQKLVKGMDRSQAPRGVTRGDYETDETKLTGPAATVEALRKALAAKSADGKTYGGVPFQINVTLDDVGQEPNVTELQDNTFVGESSSWTQGNDELVEEITLLTQRIVRNGKTLYEVDR